MDSTEEHILRLETELLQPDTRSCEGRLLELLAQDFVELGSSGRVFSRDEIIKALGKQRRLKLSIENFRARELAPGIFLATYTAAATLGKGKPKRSLRSSIWRNAGGQWQVVLHQGTPAA